MKAVILAGGLGSRLSEETETRPKPMIEIGSKPILWHIMKIYSGHGITDFIVCLGYKGYVIKEFFANYYLHSCDVTFDLARNAVEVHQSTAEPWRVTLVDTGAATMTGGRLRRVLDYVAGGTSASPTATRRRRRRHGAGRVPSLPGRLATVTAVQPPGRFGALRIGRPRRRGRDGVGARAATRPRRTRGSAAAPGADGHPARLRMLQALGVWAPAVATWT